MKLAAAPELLLRQLFEATRLTIHLSDDSDDVTITLPADELPTIAEAVHEYPPGLATAS